MAEKQRNPIVDQAIRAVGGVTAVHRITGKPRQSIYLWKEVPAECVLAIERATGISRHRMRPDVFGPESEGADA